MDDLSTSLLTARTAQTQHSVQIAVLKKTHEMQTELLNALTSATQTQAPPPPGQGLVVDKSA
jgi:iron-sulfur cluster repair protein YtfE (RIC family)